MKLQFLAALLLLGRLGAESVLGHSHNDYEQERPLVEALEHGFEIVEADVHLIKGELYVAHLRPLFPKESRTLRKLYLEPLLARFRAQGQIGGKERPFLLMIDFKSEAAPTWEVLRTQLEDFRAMLTEFDQNEVIRPGAVTVFISGNRPVAPLRKAKRRLAALDGRPHELGRGWPAALTPVVSAPYQDHFRWRGQGEPPAEEVEAFRMLCAKAKSEGKKVRLWGSPESRAVWRVLIEAGADVINTDELEAFATFRDTLD